MARKGKMVRGAARGIAVLFAAILGLAAAWASGLAERDDAPEPVGTSAIAKPKDGPSEAEIKPAPAALSPPPQAEDPPRMAPSLPEPVNPIPELTIDAAKTAVDIEIKPVGGELPSPAPPSTPPPSTALQSKEPQSPALPLQPLVSLVPQLPEDGVLPGGEPIAPPKSEGLPAPTATPLGEYIGGFYRTNVDPPLGFSGRSSVRPSETQTDNHFVPMEDRWRIGFPTWDRYGNNHPRVDDYPFVEGSIWDPFNQNVLKGDYPIFGQHTFFVLTASSISLFEFHQVPIPTTPFESTDRPRSYPFFGRPNQFLYEQYFSLAFDLFHGDAGFRQPDWRIKFMPIFNINYLAGREVGVVSPDVRDGVDRVRTFTALEEWFVETKLADLGPNFDFVSARVGSQPFVSDFRGFIFADTNRAARIFGTLDANREQFNLIFLMQQEKDTNSGLNTMTDRHQRILIGNMYIQDFVYPGYTAQFNVAYNHDAPTFKFDKNDFLVRPDPVGVFQPHAIDAVYLGWTGDGHIDRINITHAFYWALGHDSLNPLANRPQNINAQMAALELSYDRDWARFRTSIFYSSGDRNPRNGHATGFDSIFDNPQFAGGEFSYWQRQSIRLLGVGLVQRESLIPDLRSSKSQGQSNFVNPGLQLFNVGVDFEITPKLRMINNANFLWFDSTESLKLFTFQDNIRRTIGTDLSAGFEYRPLLSNNIIMKGGVSALLPGRGFRDVYNNIRTNVDALFAVFTNVEFTY